MPSDACSVCRAIYSKVEEAIDAGSEAREAEPIAGWALFLGVAGVATACGAVVGLIGWEGLAFVLIFIALYALNNAKKIRNSTSSPWLRRFLAQPEKRRANAWDRMSTLQRIAAFIGFYMVCALLYVFVALPLLKLMLTGTL